MWAGVPREPTHTVDELLELAGMKTDTKPFDLVRALKGEPVVLRNGLKAYVRHHETELESAPPLLGFFVQGGSLGIGQWCELGENYWSIGESEYDIVGMWVEPLIFEHWNLLNEDIKYLAKDDDGRWFGYIRKPSKDEEGWGITLPYTGYYSLAALDRSLFPECDWRQSLIERPENE